MAIDPVCEMTVNEATAAATSTYKGQTYYFCSALCKSLFDREPEKYLQETERQKEP
ncbi:MAG: YHS domain-containing protein [Chloroflexi bacterium]|nr:YHS domain-containing protein [Chloroflexota bacterium]